MVDVELVVNNAVEIKLHAKQRAGQMLSEGKKAGDIKTQRDNQKACTKPSTSEIGITRNESSDWQKLAAVPEKVLEKAITIVKERDGVLTEAASCCQSIRQHSNLKPDHKTGPHPVAVAKVLPKWEWFGPLFMLLPKCFRNSLTTATSNAMRDMKYLIAVVALI